MHIKQQKAASTWVNMDTKKVLTNEVCNSKHKAYQRRSYNAILYMQLKQQGTNSEIPICTHSKFLMMNDFWGDL